ncbi:MAG TPA: DUF6588 family protein [Bacteroidales bacterium]|nr:DUF6588 family protein [Bacteroidales bacterium]
MKKLRPVFATAVLSVLFVVPTWSQIKQVDFIKGGFDDGQVMFKEYLAPYANSFAANLNGGWYNSAKPHKLGGFDITLTLNTSWAPPSARTMDLTGIGLSDAATIQGDPITPTIAGKKTDTRPDIAYQETYTDLNGNQQTVTLASYTTPNGTGMNAVPLPMAQLGIGLPLGTDVSVRYLPNLNFGDYGSIGLWGVGLKHSILQHIPGLKHLPVLDVSVQGGYTSLKTFANVNFMPSDYPEAVDLVNDALLFNDQKIQVGVTAWTVNLIASQTLPVISFYEGIGYSNSKANVGLYGNFPVARLETDPSNDHFGDVVVAEKDVYKDPFDVTIENHKDLRLNVGMRLKLGVLTIQFDYTKANYSVFTTGLGISFR